MKSRPALIILLISTWIYAPYCAAQSPKPAPPTPPAPAKPAPAAPPAGSPQSADDWDRKGALLLNDNKPSDAVDAFKQALSKNAKDVRAFVGLGTAYRVMKRYDDAIQAFRSAVDLNPTTEFQLGLADVLNDAKRFREALNVLGRIRDASPNDVRIRAAIGDTYLRERDYAAAEQAFLDALGFAPDNPSIHVALGNIYEQEERHADALEEYDAALRVAPADMGGLLGRAEALSGLKEYDEAERMVRGLIVKAPRETSLHSTLALILDAAGKHAEAISEYRRAIALAPNDAYLWGNLGWAQYNAGQLSDAIDSSRKALTMEGSLAYVQYNLGLIYAVQDRWATAKTEYDKAIAISVPAELRAAIGDVNNALTKTPSVSALQQALTYLTDADTSGAVVIHSDPVAPPATAAKPR